MEKRKKCTLSKHFFIWIEVRAEEESSFANGVTIPPTFSTTGEIIKMAWLRHRTFVKSHLYCKEEVVSESNERLIYLIDACSEMAETNSCLTIRFKEFDLKRK